MYMCRPFWSAFQIWFYLFHCTVKGQAYVRLSDINKTISSFGELQTLMLHTPARLTIEEFCSMDHSSCQSSCKRTAEGAFPGRGNRLGTLKYCYCDVHCLAYGDCCKDFHSYCPHLVKDFLESPQRHSQAECIEDNAFLVHKGRQQIGHDTLSTDRDTARPRLTLRDVEETLKVDNTVVTDSETNIQYKSTSEFIMMHPEAKRLETRLRRWDPMLLFPRPPAIKDLVKLVQNVSTPFVEGVRLSFNPYDETLKTRKCQLQAVLTCPMIGEGDGVITVRLENTSYVCQFVTPAPDEVSVGQPVDRPAKTVKTMPALQGFSVFIVKQVDRGDDGDAQSQGAGAVGRMDDGNGTLSLFGNSTTLDGNSTIEKPSGSFIPQSLERDPIFCNQMLVRPGKIADIQADYRVLLDPPSSDGNGVGFIAAASYYKWKSIHCVKKTRSGSSIESDHEASCVPKVLCGRGLVYINGECSPPSMMMLHVTSTDQDEGQPNSPDTSEAIEELFLQFASELNRTEFVTYTHRQSCLIGNNSAVVFPNKNSLSSYYGLYHIVRNRLEPVADDYNMPISSLIVDALTYAYTKTMILLKAEICFYAGRTEETGSRLKQFLDEARGYRQNHQMDNLMKSDKCSRIPWPWQNGSLYDNPDLLCEYLEARPGASIYENNADQLSCAVALLLLSWLLLSVFVG